MWLAAHEAALTGATRDRRAPDPEAARKTLDRALASLPKRKHIKVWEWEWKQGVCAVTRASGGRGKGSSRAALSCASPPSAAGCQHQHLHLLHAPSVREDGSPHRLCPPESLFGAVGSRAAVLTLCRRRHGHMGLCVQPGAQQAKANSVPVCACAVPCAMAHAAAAVLHACSTAMAEAWLW